MDNQENVVGARPSAAERPQESGAAALGRGGRMSRQRKTAAVLRLLPVAVHSGEGPMTEPTADTPACRWELVKLPRSRHLPGVRTGAIRRLTDVCAGLLAYRELDDALHLTDTAANTLADTRTGRHRLGGMLRQSVFGRLAGYQECERRRRAVP
jgi:hypothetical protein